jgi:hypothetical protein
LDFDLCALSFVLGTQSYVLVPGISNLPML